MKARRSTISVSVIATCLVVGCGSMSKDDRIDYRSAAEAPSLEVPPDLTAPTESDRYAVSDLDPRGVATYSAYSAERGGERPVAAAAPAAAAPGAAAPVAAAVGSVVAGVAPGMHIERNGTQRWLVVEGVPPEKLWPKVREFWIALGFVLSIDRPEIGIMETDWAENRAKIPDDFIRRTIGRVIDNVYSTPERDKYRTRLEAAAAGSTEVFISHRGVMEIYPNEAQDRTIWQPRPVDPELEAEMLRRLMVKLGATEETAQAAVAAGPAPERARIESADAGERLLVADSFDRAWRRVGLALDRTGFTVEDRDRSQGVYFVRYVDPEADNSGSKRSLLSRLAFWRSDDKKPGGGDQYRILVAGQGDERSSVSVLTREGGADRSETAKRILTVLHEQLR